MPENKSNHGALWVYGIYKERVKERIRLSDFAILHYAKKQTKRLLALATGPEHADIRTFITELGIQHITNLLRERKSLRVAFKLVQNLLKSVEWRKKDRKDYELKNTGRTVQTIEDLAVKLHKNESDIKETLNMLRHLEADLALATVDTYKRDEITSKLRGIVSHIQQNTTAIEEAQMEVDDHAHQRPRRLTE